MSRGFIKFGRASAAAILALSGAIALPPSTRGAPGDELLVNGGFVAGDGALPAGWYAYALPDCSTHFNWHKAKDSPAEIEIGNENPAEAGISQTVVVGPGWYHVSGEVRAQDISVDGAGVQLCLQNYGHSVGAVDRRGTTEWGRVGFYFKTEAKRREIIVVCRLGKPGLENTGTAFFRNVSLTQIAAPPATVTYDLDALWGTESARVYSTPGTGNWLGAFLAHSRWSLVATFALLFLGTAWGLYLVRDESPGR